MAKRAWYSKRKARLAAEFACLMGGLIVFHATTGSIANNASLAEIAVRAVITFGVASLFMFFAVFTARRQSLDSLSPWFVGFCVGAAILYVPGMVIFRRWWGGVVLPAVWLAVVVAARSLVVVFRSR
jgi:hypothetical protein